jgi:hypothetical protein
VRSAADLGDDAGDGAVVVEDEPADRGLGVDGDADVERAAQEAGDERLAEGADALLAALLRERERARAERGRAGAAAAVPVAGRAAGDLVEGGRRSRRRRAPCWPDAAIADRAGPGPLSGSHKMD